MTNSVDDVGNLAPNSFFSVACASPPIVWFTSVGRKHPLQTSRPPGDVVSVAIEPMLHLVNNNNKANFDADVDVAEALGIALPWPQSTRPSAQPSRRAERRTHRPDLPPSTASMAPVMWDEAALAASRGYWIVPFAGAPKGMFSIFQMSARRATISSMRLRIRA